MYGDCWGKGNDGRYFAGKMGKRQILNNMAG